MKLDLSKSFDASKALNRLQQLIEKGAKIELREILKKRTINQNSYLHACISLFAVEFGYTLEEAKTHLKRECEFMRYVKGDEVFLKQTSGMDTKQLSDFIEWIRNYSSEKGCYIPSAGEYLENQFYIDKEIEKNKCFL